MDRVVEGLRGFRGEFRPTYENRASFQEIAKKWASFMRGELPDESHTIPMFDRDTWNGYWEGDSDLALKIRDYGNEISVQEIAEDIDSYNATSLSTDNRILETPLSHSRKCTITLTSIYDGEYEVINLVDRKTVESGKIHKLIPATEDMKRMTRRPPEPALLPGTS